MLKIYYFSKTTLSFYPGDMLDDYKKARTLPEDLIEVPYSTFEEFALNNPPIGHRLAFDGSPYWDKIPDDIRGTTTPEEERQWRNLELKYADLELFKVQDADPKSKGTVADWRRYRRELRSWPDNINFPQIEFRPKPPTLDT